MTRVYRGAAGAVKGRGWNGAGQNQYETIVIHSAAKKGPKMLRRAFAVLAFIAVVGQANAAAPTTGFSPSLEYDAAVDGLCQAFLEDVRADFFDGAPGVSLTKRHRKAPPVFSNALSDALVENKDFEKHSYASLTRHWGDIDGDGAPEEVAMTTAFGDRPSGFRTFVGLTKLDPEGVRRIRAEWRRLFEAGYVGPLSWRTTRPRGILNHIMNDTYIFVGDYGTSAGSQHWLLRKHQTLTRDPPSDSNLASVVTEATNYRLPFRLVEYRGRLYAETIVDLDSKSDKSEFVSDRRVLLSFDKAMSPRPECIAAESPQHDFPASPLSRSTILRDLLSTVDAIGGQDDCSYSRQNPFVYSHRARIALLREVGARPWLVSERTNDYNQFSSKFVAFGKYDWLRIWRLFGPWNAKKFDAMERLGEESIGELTKYYSSAFAVDQLTAATWAHNSVEAIKAAAAMRGPEVSPQLVASVSRIEKGTATTEDFVELVRVLWRYQDKTENEVLAEALGMALSAKADDALVADLMARGADINLGDQTAVMRAIGDPRRVALLINDGADARQPNSYGKTPLMMAAHLDDLKSLNLILDQAVDVNARTKRAPESSCHQVNISNRTALMYAAENASPRLLKVLLNAGADATAVDSQGRGALDYLSRNITLTQRSREKMRRTLIKAGAVK